MNADPIRVLQLTDCHLPDAPDARVQGMDTNGSLSTLLEQILGDVRSFDLALLTGDLVEQPTPSAYALLSGHLRALPMPFVCLPGNHDDASLLRDILPAPSASETLIAVGNWRILSLDSTLPGRSEGFLRVDQLERIASAIAEAPAAHLLIAVHHHPVPCGSPWMDEMMMANGEALLDRLGGLGTGTRAVVFGHIHQAFDTTVGGVRLLGCPATSCQFEPRTAAFLRSDLPPGYRWLELWPDGELRTGVGYLNGPFAVPP